MAPLQKRALFSFVAGAIITIALIVVFLYKGDVTALDREPGVRFIMYAALIGVPLVYLILVSLILRKPTQVDERDRLIVDRSARVQWLAVLFTVAAWTIILTEVYHKQRQVPVVFLNLIFVSTLIVGTLGQSLGIFLGYIRLDRNV